MQHNGVKVKPWTGNGNVPTSSSVKKNGHSHKSAVNGVNGNHENGSSEVGTNGQPAMNGSKAAHVVTLYDTTLRDGAQGEGVNFSTADKLLLAKKLDEFGVHYVEGGWPHPANLKDREFFREAKSLRFSSARLVAFGSTRLAKNKADDDENLRGLLDSNTPTVAIFGKSSVLHVDQVCKVERDVNLAMIFESVAHLKKNGREVIFDAEHFFDGYRDNPKYALKCLEAAQDAGADWLVLCDTNGGTLPDQLRQVLLEMKGALGKPFGIHAHNDSECAVANSVLAVKLGARQVQGTMNGLGERCGNANLCAVIPNLQLKMGFNCMSNEKLGQLRSLSLYVSELANRPPRDEAAFVGTSAFAHKGGIHINAVRKTARAYEHIDPALVGNHTRILVSDQSGVSTVRWKAEGYGFKFEKGDERARKVLDELKRLEAEGYHFEGAEASFELMVNRLTRGMKRPFNLLDFHVDVNGGTRVSTVSKATLKVQVDDETEHAVAEGDGPVNAMDKALRKALGRFFPELNEVRLVDYKVRVVNPQASTAAKVRVLIESTDGRETWTTVGVSENIIEASLQALSDSVTFKLLHSRMLLEKAPA